jgi:hypothetical protein
MTGVAHRVVARAEDGARVGITLPADLVVGIDEYWPPIGLGQPNEGDDDPPTEVDLELAVPERGSEPGLMVDELDARWVRLESDLSLFAADHLVGRVAVHAGVVLAHGRIVLVPGSTHAGKSTLCLALQEAGGVVLSDEYAVVDPASGLVTGWPRPMRRRRPDGGIDRIPLGPVSAGPLPVTLVAALRYQSDAGLNTRTTPPSEVVTALLANTVSAQRHPDLALTAALAIARTARGLIGTRGEADEAAALLLAALAPEPTAV